MSGPSPSVGRLKVAPAALIPIAPAVAKITTSEQRPSPELVYRVATSLSAVLEAWQLVHDCHRDQGLIAGNAARLHTTVQAASAGATVLRAEAAGELVATLTITRDGGRGLSLDAVFGRELEPIHRTGQRLSEVGLMATRGVPNGLERLLSISLECALRDHFSAVVMAVESRHAAYYERMFGFEIRGYARPTSRRSSEGRTLILVDRDAFLRTVEPPPGIRALRASPVPADFCAGAFGFLTSQLTGTPLAAHLAELEKLRAAKRTHSVR